jgi:hypothetical protein
MKKCQRARRFKQCMCKCKEVRGAQQNANAGSSLRAVTEKFDNLFTSIHVYQHSVPCTRALGVIPGTLAVASSPLPSSSSSSWFTALALNKTFRLLLLLLLLTDPSERLVLHSHSHPATG